MRKNTIRLVSCAALIVLCMSLSACSDTTTNTSNTSTTQTEKKTTVEQTTEEKSTQEESKTEAPSTKNQDAEREAFKEEIGGSGLTFYNNVRNDVTGNWRVSVIYSNAVMQEHAVNYYKAYFTDNNEIHFVCNLGLKTTTRIKVVAGELEVTVFEYVQSEEHDAKVLPGGQMLAQYYVNMETGAIEEIDIGADQ